MRDLGLIFQATIKSDKKGFRKPLQASKLAEHCRETDFQFHCDGIVIKVTEGLVRDQLKSTSRVPKWALAYKPSPTTVVTALLDVIVQVGRTGRMTPVAILQPTLIDGVTITRATLHNFPQAQQILSPSTSNTTTTTIPVNSTVLVSRAGDVIPQILQTISIPPSSNNNNNNTSLLISLEIPQQCPVCQTPTVIEDSSSIMVTCPNVHCPSRSIQKLVHAVSRNALDIPNLSRQRLEQLNVTYIHELFDLTIDDLEQLPGWATTSATSLVNSLQNKEVSLSAFIYSLGIRHVGKHTSQLLAQHYQTIHQFLSSLLQPQQNHPQQVMEDDDLTSINVKGIGPATIASLQHYGQVHYTEAQILSQKLTVLPETTATTTTNNTILPWSGWKVVFTGSLSNRTRSQAQEEAKRILGASSTPSTLSKTTNLLIIGEKTSSNKLVKAQELDIPIINETQFQQLLSQYKQVEDE